LASTSNINAVMAELDRIKGLGFEDGVDDLHALKSAVNSRASAASLVAFQSAAMATVATIPELVWDVLLPLHVADNSTGLALTLASRAPTTGEIADDLAPAIWATAEGGARGSMGAAVTLVRKWITNAVTETSGAPGSVVLFEDGGVVPLLTWPLRDQSGGAVIAQAGAPARRGQAT
jgi:hypothetical protein